RPRPRCAAGWTTALHSKSCSFPMTGQARTPSGPLGQPRILLGGGTNSEARVMRICVHSNRGSRGEESPCAFYLGGRRLPVLAVLERWQDATHHYHEVMVDDGRRFVL